MINVGTKLDLTFRLPVMQAGQQREVAFADLLTRRTVVSVYMKNNTPGCDRQNDSLAAHSADFERRGYNLIALSRDTCGSHARYAAKKGIAHTLASDPEDKFARATDSLVEKAMYGRGFVGPLRAAYVLDRDGTVLAIIEKVDTSGHARQVLNVLDGLK